MLGRSDTALFTQLLDCAWVPQVQVVTIFESRGKLIPASIFERASMTVGDTFMGASVAQVECDASGDRERDEVLKFVTVWRPLRDPGFQVFDASAHSFIFLSPSALQARPRVR